LVNFPAFVVANISEITILFMDRKSIYTSGRWSKIIIGGCRSWWEI